MLASLLCSCPVVSCIPNVSWWAFAARRWESSGTRERHAHWLHKDTCGLTTASLTQLLIAGAAYIGLRYLLYPWLGFSIIFCICGGSFCTLLALGSISHLRAMFTDPGCVPKHAIPLPSDLSEFRASGSRNIPRCKRSGVYKPPRAHFDSGVKRCVVKMDHHCPWVNNCVGICNQKYFILFCFYVGASSMLALSFMFVRFIYVCGFNKFHHSSLTATTGEADSLCKPDPVSSIMMALLGFESLLFGLFTTCMFCDQVYSITTNETYIDRLKAGGKKQKVRWCNSSFFEHFQEVVGDADGALLRWWLPVDPQWKDREQVLGFCAPGSVRGTRSSFQLLHGSGGEELAEPP